MFQSLVSIADECLMVNANDEQSGHSSHRLNTKLKISVIAISINQAGFCTGFMIERLFSWGSIMNLVGILKEFWDGVNKFSI